jgi:23S rRNA pseudouridine1911/1915/1917 synthase
MAMWSGNARAEDAGARLDRWLSERLPALSRMRIKALVEEGHVRVGGRRPKGA